MRLLIPILAVWSVAPAAPAQSLSSTEVRGGVHMLEGRGGNIGVFTGEDGVLLIDDQFADATPAIRAEVEKLTERPIRFLINTHWHGDHTGGNENFGKAGVLIVAHENVRERLSTEQNQSAFGRTVPPSPRAALPVVTFRSDVTFHWNGDEVEVFHVDRAHTDGDAIVHFRRANVVHMGDCFFNGLYPFIDPDSGGVIDGMVRAADRVLARIDDDTRIIPGHGPLGTKADLQAFRDMLDTVRGRIAKMIAEGKSKEEVVAARPTREFDETWGRGFLSPDRFVGIVYEGMVRQAAAGDGR